MDLQRTSACAKFAPNQFNRSRCQSCFRSMELHSEDALQSRKMNRKVTKCGFLYVAPDGIDFDVPAQRSKRWQRRWFALYDDGELSYALDQYADTVPQRVIDMTCCTEVIESQLITGHNNSLRITTNTDQYHYVKADNADEIKWWRDLLCIYSKQLARRKMRLLDTVGDGTGSDKDKNGPVVADGGNAGPTLVQIKNSPQSSSFRGAGDRRSQRRTSDPSLSLAKVDLVIRPTTGGNNDSSLSSYHGTPRSVKNRRTGRNREDAARSKTFSEFDITGVVVANKDRDHDQKQTTSTTTTVMIDGCASNNDWTVQVRSGGDSGGRRQSRPCSSSDNATTDKKSDEEKYSYNANTEENESQNLKQQVPLSRLNGEREKPKQEQDNFLHHTLRKGWLMLKDQSDSGWSKYWVVLAGLSLKMYKDAWAENGGTEASVGIDLSDCEAASPLSEARNYGIEVKCKHRRYVFSALTPGIRESWIAAIQQNLLNNNNIVSAVVDSSDANEKSFMNQSQKKRRIAYVAPESHRRDAMCTAEDGEENDHHQHQQETEEDLESVRSNSRTDGVSTSLSGRSLESSLHEFPSDDASSTYSGLSTPRRRRSLSPTIRRSPVSRVKERDTSRRRHSPASQLLSSRSSCDGGDNHHSNHRRSNASSSTSAVVSSTTTTIGIGIGGGGGEWPSSSAARGDSDQVIRLQATGTVEDDTRTAEANLIAMLQQQLETVRQELERTRGRLSETKSENERLRIASATVNGDRHREQQIPSAPRSAVTTTTGSAETSSTNGSEAELERLRRTLQEAERDIWSKQDEIEVLTRKLDHSLTELSDTETVLTSSLKDLEKPNRAGAGCSDEQRKFPPSASASASVSGSSAALSTDWSRRVNAMEKQLRKTIQRLDERERELTHYNGDHHHQKRSLIPQQQQQQSTADQNDEIIAQLQSKLTESEARVAELKGKLLELEDRSQHNNYHQNGFDHSKLENGQKDHDDGIRFDSLRHYCIDQNRRLLATLRNETEFLQTMVDTKLVSVDDDSTGPQAAIVGELGELSDDLIAVHHYIADMERYLQEPPPLRSDAAACGPDDFMKDFNFKDVLNRLVEVQERFASMAARRENSPPSTVSRHNNNTSEEHGSAGIIKMHDDINKNLHENTTTTNLVNTSFDFRSYWNYCVSVLHGDLARSLAAYLEKKYEESAHCTVLTSDDLQSILAETMALEACLFAEIVNVIEASKNDEYLESALKLRDIRNTFVVLRRLEDLLLQSEDEDVDDHRLTAVLEAQQRIDVNFFNILCEETKTFVLAHLKDLIPSLPFNWQKKLRFGPGDSDSRSIALRVLSKNLLRDLIVFESASLSNQEEISSCSIQLLRSTVLKDEITHILARLETNLDASSSSSLPMRSSISSGEVVGEAVTSTISLCDRMIAKLNHSIDNLYGNADTSNNKRRSGGTTTNLEEPADVIIKNRLTNFLKNLKKSSGNNSTTYMEGVFQQELEDVAESSLELMSRTELKRLANLKCSRAVVRGYRSSILHSYAEEMLSFKPTATSKRGFDFSATAAGVSTEFGEFLSAGMKLNECVAHYEPLTKQLFYRILSNVSTKLVAVQLSIYYECQLKEAVSASSSSQMCEFCSNNRSASINGRGGQMLQNSPESYYSAKSFHSDELEGIRTAHTAEVQSLTRELAAERERRNKLHADVVEMKKITDHTLATLDRARSQLMEEMQNEHRREMQRITREYEKTLKEEKDATRRALDALQKSHQNELDKQAEKMRKSMSRRPSVGSDYENVDDHCCGTALQDISRQLSEVSSAYSAKCIENLRMDERLQEARKILNQIATDGSVADDLAQDLDDFLHNCDRASAFDDALNTKEAEINHYKELVRQLQSELYQTQDTLASVIQSQPKMDASAAMTNGSAHRRTSNHNGSERGNEANVSSSANSEDTDDADDVSADNPHQPIVVRRKGVVLSNNRRGDSRYHSTPNLGGVQATADSFILRSGQQKVGGRAAGLPPDRILHELRNVMGLTVTERRRYFENLCQPPAAQSDAT